MSTVDIIDQNLMDAMRGIEDQVTQATAHAEILDHAQYLPTFEEMAEASPTIVAEIGTGASATGAAAVALPLAVGASVETALLNNPHWDNFWIHAGANLNNWWHTSAKYLFGAPSVSMNEVAASINLSQHITMRAVRQLYSRVLSRALTGITNLAKVVNRQQKEISILAKGVLSLKDYTNQHLLQAISTAEHHSDAQLHKYQGDVVNALHANTAFMEKWTTQHIYDPLHTEVVNLNKDLQHYKTQVPHIAHIAAVAEVAVALAPLAKTIAQHTKMLQQLEQESEECTQPMCETVGPKSDWGKLLKRFGPKLIFALLAELAALNPREVEAASVDLADGLGPVLESWVAKYVGILPGGTHTQPAAVSHALGPNPLGI